MDWNAFLGRWRQGNDKPPEPKPPIVSECDDEDECLQEPEAFLCEGQSFMIEYVSSKGERSRRSISVWSVKFNKTGIPLIMAKCHHRNANRTFRADRIECCIDYDGEIHEPKSFLSENLGLKPNWENEIRDTSEDQFNTARSRARHHAVLLAALSRCDGYLHPSELSILQLHCERFCSDLPLEDCDRLVKSYKRLRPTPEQVERAVEALRSEPPDILERFILSAYSLIEADGKLLPEEIELFSEFYLELTGTEWRAH